MGDTIYEKLDTTSMDQCTGRNVVSASSDAALRAEAEKMRLWLKEEGAPLLAYCLFLNYRRSALLIKSTLKIHFKMVKSPKYDIIN